MPLPTLRDVRADVLLTNVLIGYHNAEYIADRVLPDVPVNDQSGYIPALVQSDWFRDAAELRAPGTKSRRGSFSTDLTATYFCHKYSWGHEIPDDLRRNARDPFNLDEIGARFAMDKVYTKRERLFVTNFMTTSIWGTDKTGATDFTKFSDYGASKPLVVLTGYKDLVEAKIGREPNKLVIGKDVWSQLKWHPDVIDTIKHTQTAMMTQALFSALMEIEELLVGKAIQTTSAAGTAEASVTYSRIWGKDGLFLYTPKTASLMEPSAGYTFSWNPVSGADGYIKRMRNEENEIDIVEANSSFAQVKTVANAGLFMDEMVA